MKRNLSIITLLIALIVALFSCSKDEQEPLEAGSAKVSGKLTANLDAGSITNQPVPAGTGVTFIIDGADLDMKPDPNYTYDMVIRRASVGANGKYSITLPARQKPITVEVIFDDFEYDAVVLTTDDNGFQITTTARKVFSSPNAFITIVEGQVEILDRVFDMQFNDFTNSAIVKGKIDAVFVDNVGEVTNTDMVNQGTGYTVGSNINVSGGSGTGLTINITSVGGAGEVLFYTINNPGNNYQIDDMLTISSGDANATFRVTNVDPEAEGVPEGVVLSFTTDNGNGNEYKTTTNTDGYYQIHLPVVPVAGTDIIMISFADFENSSVYLDGTSYVTGDKIYSRGNTSITIAKDNILEHNFTYIRTN